MEQVLEINKTYEFPFGIITEGNDILLFDNAIFNYSCSKDDALKNVKVLIDNLGLLHIEADQLIWKLTTDKINIKDVEEEVHELSIHHEKGCKWLGIKPYSYVIGWYRLKNLKPVKYILKNYKITIRE